jgi:hypothetical protein
MNIAREFLDSITILYQDTKWTQSLDYDHIPFQCRKFHEHGNLFRDYIKNAENSPGKAGEEEYKEGFKIVLIKRRSGRKKSK